MKKMRKPIMKPFLYSFRTICKCANFKFIHTMVTFNTIVPCCSLLNRHKGFKKDCPNGQLTEQVSDKQNDWN